MKVETELEREIDKETKRQKDRVYVSETARERQPDSSHTQPNTEETGPGSARGGRCERAGLRIPLLRRGPPTLRADSHPFPTILKSSFYRALRICHRRFLTRQRLEQVSVATKRAWVCVGDRPQVEWPRTVGEGKG